MLREVSGDREPIESRLGLIKQHGVPNYFGEQRFGRDGGNLDAAEAMFSGHKIKDRHLRSLYLSSARSFLFNKVLAARVQAGSWDKILPGEVVMLSGSRSFFPVETVDAEITARLASGDIHPSGPLWGRGELATHGEAGYLEREIMAEHPLFCEGLERAGLKQERRALRLLVNDLHWQWLDDTSLQTSGEVNNGPVLRLEFSLPPGAFGTALLREVSNYHQV